VPALSTASFCAIVSTEERSEQGEEVDSLPALFATLFETYS
jgi:hypothetical protein